MKWNGQFGLRSGGGSACMHPSIHPHSQTWPHFPGHFSNFPRCCVGVRFSPRPIRELKRRFTHLSRNNASARSNYITLSGKGAAVLASNLFAFSLPVRFPRGFFKPLAQECEIGAGFSNTGEAAAAKKKGERRQSAKVASFHLNTFFSFPLDV